MLRHDNTTPDVVVSAAENLFLLADSWGVFVAHGLSVHELLEPGRLTVLDVSSMQSAALKDIVVALLSQRIFEYQVAFRQRFEQEPAANIIADALPKFPLITIPDREAEQIMQTSDEEDECPVEYELTNRQLNKSKTLQH